MELAFFTNSALLKDEVDPSSAVAVPSSSPPPQPTTLAVASRATQSMNARKCKIASLLFQQTRA
jgi:hypothetical protein